MDERVTVTFRTDASLAIGHGHVMRCLTLARVLRDGGVTVLFICREHEGHLCDLIAERGFPVSRLPAPRVEYWPDTTPTHADWLGAPWQEDAQQTLAALTASSARPDWLVVDHYAIDSRWESALRTAVVRIMAIDDLADRAHDCDLLLDQNLVAQMDTRYAAKIPVTCRTLLGPEYALLQPIYAQLHDRVPPRDGVVRRVFVFFGGTDSHNLTGRTLNALLRMNRPDIMVDVVITSNSSHAVAVRQLADGHNNIQLHSSLPTLAPLMAKADLAVGGGGVTGWERLCLGLPSLVVTLAENQRDIAAELSSRGLIRWLGHYDTVDEFTIARALSESVQGGTADWSRHCSSTVDGRGVVRVRAALIATTTTPLRVRAARLEDEAMVLKWANDPATRRNAFRQGHISAATHHVWFRNRLRNAEGGRFYVVETADGVAIGQVRFERVERAWEIHYLVDPTFRGRGLGRPLLRAAMLEFGATVSGAEVFGQVKSDNHASRRIFESLGFHTEPGGGHEGPIVYRRIV